MIGRIDEEERVGPASSPDGSSQSATGHAGGAAVPADSAPVDGSGVDRPRVVDDWARPEDPRWTRPALLSLLVVTAVSYLWDLGRNGFGNSFYAAAVQSGTKSWSSFFSGSLDWGNYITVDKPPASLWLMSLSGRIFGFSSWSMLAPEALLGVASVAVLFAAVRRVWGAPAGLLAGAALALTPAAALMFRFNNPDALLTFLLVCAAYAVTRSLERASLRWLVAAAAVIGTAFIAKSLQAMLVVPGIGLAYLLCAPTTWWRRLRDLAVGTVALVVSALWWPVIVDSIPASSRPYVGGSTTNNVLQLAFGYNGLNRLTGSSGARRAGAASAERLADLAGSGAARGAADVAGAGGFTGAGGFAGAGGFTGAGGSGGTAGGRGFGGGFGGSTGLTRLFNGEFSGFIAWLLPAALIALVVGIWLTRRTRWADPRRGSLILWGGWVLVTAGVLSYMSGTVHSYYTVALAPGVAALAGMLLPALWRRRAEVVPALALAAMALAAAVTGYVLLGQAPHWLPWLRPTVLVAGLVGAVALLGALRSRAVATRVATWGAVLSLAAGAAGPLAWSVATINSSHTGSSPSVGPVQARSAGFGSVTGASFAQLRQAFAERFGGTGTAGGFAGGGGFGGSRTAGASGGFGRGEESADTAVVKLLKQGSAGYRWAAAVTTSMTAAPLQLAADAPVMALGGFSGSDPAITLAEFKADVAAHKIHYYLGSEGRGFGGGGSGALSSISEWVSQNFTATTVGSTTVYDLSSPKA